MVIGCAGLQIFDDDHDGRAKVGELYCLAVDPTYRESGRGEAIVEYIADRARGMGLSHLFVLTTQTAHFFRERGFHPVRWTELPPERRARYDKRRKSKVLFREL
jgi:amino-acid N-acetyltransferase